MEEKDDAYKSSYVPAPNIWISFKQQMERGVNCFAGMYFYWLLFFHSIFAISFGILSFSSNFIATCPYLLNWGKALAIQHSVAAFMLIFSYLQYKCNGINESQALRNTIEIIRDIGLLVTFMGLIANFAKNSDCGELSTVVIVYIAIVSMYLFLICCVGYFVICWGRFSLESICTSTTTENLPIVVKANEKYLEVKGK